MNHYQNYAHKNLIVWQKSMDLVHEVYSLTSHFPNNELFGLTNQMRRASVSIPSNIAEGRSRGTTQQYRSFLRISYASAAELETQVQIAKRIFSTQDINFQPTEKLLDEVLRMLGTLIHSLNTKIKIS